METQSTPSSVSLSPSFSTHSSHKLAEIAARVMEEFSVETNSDADQLCTVSSDEFRDQQFHNISEIGGFEEKFVSDDTNDKEEGDEFEFPLLSKDSISCPSPADEIFCNGEILPIYPVFNTNLALDGDGFLKHNSPAPEKVIRLPLGVLFRKERETTSSSCSSSDVDELDGIPPGTYCVWNPNSVSPATEKEGRWRKSTSTGSSKQWRLKDLIHRSSSDGSKDRFVFLTPVHKIKEKKVGKIEKPKVVGKHTAAAEEVKGGGERRRPSLLPNRLDLVGLFSNTNGRNWNSHPF